MYQCNTALSQTIHISNRTDKHPTKTFPEYFNIKPSKYYFGKLTHRTLSYLTNSSKEEPYYFGKLFNQTLGLSSTKKVPTAVDPPAAHPPAVKFDVCHTQVGKRKFSIVTVIEQVINQPYVIHHMIVKDHIMDHEQLLTAIKAPYWKSIFWTFDPEYYGVSDQIFDTSYSVSSIVDADTRTDIHCFTVDGHAFSLILNRSVLDVHFGVCSGDIRPYIGKVTKLDSPDDNESVVTSNKISAWWNLPTPKEAPAPAAPAPVAPAPVAPAPAAPSPP